MTMVPPAGGYSASASRLAADRAGSINSGTLILSLRPRSTRRPWVLVNAHVCECDC